MLPALLYNLPAVLYTVSWPFSIQSPGRSLYSLPAILYTVSRPFAFLNKIHANVLEISFFIIFTSFYSFLPFKRIFYQRVIQYRYLVFPAFEIIHLT